MARSYGRTATAKWRDTDHRQLSLLAQWTYEMLYSQPEITPAGSITVALRRWAGYCPDVTVENLRAALVELEEHNYVVIDWETEELLVRTFVKHDGGTGNDLRRRAIIASAGAIEAPSLQSAVIIELDRLAVSHGLSKPYREPIEGGSKDDRGAVEARRVVVTKVVTPTTHNPDPESTTLEPASQSDAARKRATRATKIPDDWRPTDADIAWARSQGYDDLTQRRETETFKDHWSNLTTPQARKLDWSKAWKNWMRKVRPSAQPPQSGINPGYQFGM